MSKKKISVTIEADLVDAIDALASTERQNRSELIEQLLSKSIGQDGSGLIEFFRLSGPPSLVEGWMNQATDMFTDAKPEDGPVELVLRVTQKQWDRYMSQRVKDSSGNGDAE